MALNLSRIKERQLETAKGAGNFFKPDEGKNIIRIFKFKHEVTKDDVARGYFTKDELGEEVEELDRPVTLQYNLLAGSKRPVIASSASIEEWKSLNKSKLKEDQARADQIKPSKKYYLNVVDINDVDGGIKIYGASKTVYSKILELLQDPEYGGEDSLFGCKGRDFIISYDPNAEGAAMYSVTPRAEGKSEKLPKNLEADAVDLYDPDNLSMLGQVQEDDGPLFKDNNGGSDEEELQQKEDEDKVEAGEHRRKSNGSKPKDDLEEFLNTPSKKKARR